MPRAAAMTINPSWSSHSNGPCCQNIAAAQSLAAQAMDAARTATAQRDKTRIEEMDDWGAEYRSKRASVDSAQLSASYVAEHQAALMHKQMDLPIAYSNVHIPQLRRNTVQKDMPQWYQEDHKNMPDWFELRKLLDKAEPLNLFRRSESGSLSRFQQEQYRSRSTEPDFGRASRSALRNPFYRLPHDVERHRQPDVLLHENQAYSASLRSDAGNSSPLREKSPSARDLDGLSGIQLAKEMEKKDEEMMARISRAAKTISPTRSKGKSSPLKTLQGEISKGKSSPQRPSIWVAHEPY
jgi:hypothetical protein